LRPMKHKYLKILRSKIVVPKKVFRNDSHRSEIFFIHARLIVEINRANEIDWCYKCQLSSLTRRFKSQARYLAFVFTKSIEIGG